MISIVIVNYNGQKFLPRLLDSIEGQTNHDHEVLVVDNHSQDKSINFVKKHYKKAKVFVKANQGFGVACNYGAKKARGEYLVFLNEDMYLPPDFLNTMLKNYQNQEKTRRKVGGMSCKLVDFDSNPDDMPKKYGGQIDIFGFPNNYYDPKNAFTITGCPFFISRTVFLKSGGFNENIFLYGEDLDLSWRLKIFGYQNYMIHNTYIFHYGGGTTGGFGVKKIINNLFISFISIVTNYSTPVILIVFPLYLIYISFLILIIFVVKGFNVEFLVEFAKKMKSFFKNSQEIIKFRLFVQKNRVYSDLYIMRFVSLVPSVFLNKPYEKLLKNYIIKN